MTKSRPHSLKCPKCHGTSNEVIDGNHLWGGTAYRRRRRCKDCGHRFNTIEQIK